MITRRLLRRDRTLSTAMKHFSTTSQPMDNAGMLAYLTHLRESCKDVQKLASLDGTIEYLKAQNYSQNTKTETSQQKPAETNVNNATLNATYDIAGKNSAAYSHSTDEISPHKQQVSLFDDNFDIFNDMNRSFAQMETMMNRAFFGNSLFRPMFLRFHDELARDADISNRNQGSRSLNKYQEKTKHPENLFDRYQLDDDKTPEDAIGVLRHVEQVTVNGKTTAKVRVDYTLKDGRKISKAKEFLDGKGAKAIRE